MTDGIEVLLAIWLPATYTRLSLEPTANPALSLPSALANSLEDSWLLPDWSWIEMKLLFWKDLNRLVYEEEAEAMPSSAYSLPVKLTRSEKSAKMAAENCETAVPMAAVR